MVGLVLVEAILLSWVLEVSIEVVSIRRVLLVFPIGGLLPWLGAYLWFLSFFCLGFSLFGNYLDDKNIRIIRRSNKESQIIVKERVINLIRNPHYFPDDFSTDPAPKDMSI